MNILTKKLFLIVVCMFVASTGVAFAQTSSYSAIEISVDLPSSGSYIGTIAATSTVGFFNLSTEPCKNSTLCVGNFPTNAVITITATPNLGAIVAGWTVKREDGVPTGECAGITTTCTVTASTHKNIELKFTPVNNSIAISVDTSLFDQGTTNTIGTITATSIPGGVFVSNCTNSTFCYGHYSSGTVVTATATPSVGVVLIGWTVTKHDGYIGPVPTGECIGITTTCTVTASVAKIVKAKFVSLSTSIKTKLIVNNGSFGKIKITKDNSISSCTRICVATSTPLSVITLTAQPTQNAIFAGWSGKDARECAGITSTTCIVTTNIDRTINATFVKNLSLTILKEGSGKGRVVITKLEGKAASETTRILCNESCTKKTISAVPNTQYKLVAIPSLDSKFLGWQAWGPGSEQCARLPISQRTCIMVVKEGAMAIATFEEKIKQNN